MARYRTLFLGPAGVGEAILAHAHLGDQVQHILLVNSEPAGMLQSEDSVSRIAQFRVKPSERKRRKGKRGAFPKPSRGRINRGGTVLTSRLTATRIAPPNNSSVIW